MVFVEYKVSEKNKFIIRCKGQTLISQVLKQIIYVNNIRIYLDRLIWSIQEIINKGVLKPHDLQGVSFEDYQKHKQQFQHLSKEQKMYAEKPQIQKPMRYIADKHSQRYGVILPQEKHKKLLKIVNDAKNTMISKKQQVNIKQYVDCIEIIRQAMIQAYPGYLGLPEWQPSLLLLQQKLPLQVMQSQNFPVHNKLSIVWWAGKKLAKNDQLNKYCGSNQKTKIIVKIQKKGSQLPLREPPIDSETYHKMVKYYYKKVQQTKQMDNNSLQTHYQELKSTSLKDKVYFDSQIRYQPF